MNQNDELLHYGIKGQKWGIRRYQNPDGTLTSEGRKRAKQEYKADNKEAYEKGRRATIADIDLELKRRQGAKLSKAYRSYIKAGEKFVKNYDWMKGVYGLDNLSNYQIDKGRAYTAELLKNKGTI